jgi:alpha-L-rhamnosidase
VLSFSGLGFSEVAIDGRKVGDYVIGPGFRDYDHRVPYLTLDVTDRFATPGHKRLDVTLADGWYALKKDPWVHQLETKPYIDLPKVRLDLRLVHDDGTETVVVSDESWRWSTGEITRSWIPEEDVDMRKAGEGARNWQTAAVVPAPRGRLEHQREPINRIVEEFRPAAMRFNPQSGTATYDIGREVNGFVRLRARGPAGATIRITTTPTEPRSRTSVFILAGSGARETYQPKFIHAGMRRVTVTGLAGEPAADDLAICRVSSIGAPAGAFRCSDDFVNQMEETVRRTAVNYTTFLPNDPVREWKAWAQDIQSMFGSAFYLFAESQVMYERWQRDLLDSQRADGNIANVAPGPVFDPYNSPWWGGCGVWLPWEWRLAYGDDALLRESYAAMKRYVDFLAVEAGKSGGLQRWGLLDWLPVEETPVALINTPAHFHFARIVSQTAQLLGQPDEAGKYARMADQVRDVFNLNFLDPATGIYGEKGWKVQKGNWEVPGGLEPLHEIWWKGDRPCTQAGQVLPLALGLVPGAARPAAEAALLREIAAHKGRISTGFVSTPYLLDVLADLDPEACWRLATAREFPSWHSMTLGSGNDLLKETWAGGMALMPSLGGSFARWCHRALGGIKPDPDGPGFRKIIIRPTLVSSLDWVQCHHDSPYGRIVSNWRKQGAKLNMEVTIPANTAAVIYVPAKDAAGVTESGTSAAKAEGVKFLRTENNTAVYAVGSGAYRFESVFPEIIK